MLCKLLLMYIDIDDNCFDGWGHVLTFGDV